MQPRVVLEECMDRLLRELGSRRDNTICSTDCQDHLEGEPIDLEDEKMAAWTSKLKFGWIRSAQWLGRLTQGSQVQAATALTPQTPVFPQPHTYTDSPSIPMPSMNASMVYGSPRARPLVPGGNMTSFG